MYKKILVPMALDHDLSPMTLKASQVLSSPGAEIIAFHVHEALHGSASVYVDKESIEAGFANAEKLLQEKLAGLENIKPVIVKGHSARTIIDYADENDIDCIVIGSHKPGLTDYFLGSTAARVVRHAGCSVHVLRTEG